MSPRKPLREEHAQATRAAIVSAARRLFTREGYAATSLDGIASAARVTKGALYHHFDDKTDLFRAVYEELAGEVAARLRRALAQATTPLERAHLAVEAFLDCADERDVRAVMFRDGMAVLAGECRKIDERHYLRLVRDVLDELAAAGLLVTQDSGLLARLLLAAVIEASQILGAARDVAPTRAAVREALRQIVAGLVRPA